MIQRLNSVAGRGAITALGIVPVLTVALSAQSYSYSPSPSLQAAEGSGYAYTFGQHATMRSQQIEGNYTSLAIAIKETAFRADSRRSSVARQWSNVQLHCAESQLASVSNRFASNKVGGSTLVFNATMNWPATAAGAGPQPWSIRFPFARPWIKRAGADFLCEYTFSGGMLANGQMSFSERYDLDGVLLGALADNTKTYLPGPIRTSGGCQDSVAPAAAYTDLDMTVYGPGYYQAPWRNHLKASIDGGYFPSNGHPLIHVLGVPDAGGFQHPAVGCEKLYIDLRVPVVVLPNITFNSTLPHTRPKTLYLSGSPSSPPNLSPFNAAWAGTPIAVQTAWADKGTGQLLLSSATTTKIPGPPPANFAAIRRAVLWHTSLQSATGWLSSGSREDFWNCPACRYEN